MEAELEPELLLEGELPLVDVAEFAAVAELDPEATRAELLAD